MRQPCLFVKVMHMILIISDVSADCREMKDICLPLWYFSKDSQLRVFFTTAALYPPPPLFTFQGSDFHIDFFVHWDQVVSYDFKEERFAHLHRTAIGFPESRFFYLGTPASSTSKEAALKGEALVRAQFQGDPYGCQGSLYRKRLGRDPFHRSIPYPNGCPEIKDLFRYCGAGPFPGSLPWVSKIS